MLENMRSFLSYYLAPKEVKQAAGGRSGFLNAVMSTTASGAVTPRLGTSELLRSYSTMPWLRAIVNKVGKSVGTTTWKLVVVADPQTRSIVRPHKVQRASYTVRRNLLKQIPPDNVREITDHPLLDLLVHGNDQFMGMVLFQLTQQHLDLVGEAFWLMERNGLGVPVALWSIPPDWIRATPSTDDPFYRLRIGANEIKIPITEIIMFLDPDPANPYGRGSGIAKSLGDELETDDYASKHLKNFFYNRARPDMIISAENLQPDETKRLEEKWLQKHQNFWNAYRPSFLSRKVDVKELGQTFEHMQMVEIRKHERDTIIQVYGLPPEKFGIVNESKRSTIAAADLFWTKDILLPRLDSLRAVLQEQFVPLFDDRLILDFESPVVQDDEHQLNVMKAASWAYTRNEWRKFGLHPPMDESVGNVFMQPLNEYERPAEGDFVLPPLPGTEQPAIQEESLNEAVVRGLKENLKDPEKLRALVQQKIKERLER